MTLRLNCTRNASRYERTFKGNSVEILEQIPGETSSESFYCHFQSNLWMSLWSNPWINPCRYKSLDKLPESALWAMFWEISEYFLLRIPEESWSSNAYPEQYTEKFLGKFLKELEKIFSSNFLRNFMKMFAEEFLKKTWIVGESFGRIWEIFWKKLLKLFLQKILTKSW